MILPASAPAQEVPELIPVRMLNEFAYCPRLVYLEWVQGEFADNLDTLEGRFAHRRVDRAATDEVPLPPGAEGGEAPAEVAESEPAPSDVPETIHTRSLMLSAPNEGLIARIDVVDINAGTAIPVDYKRGKVPDVPGNAWEPEQVQLCAQGLVLRENGYQCEGGILYYVESRRRVSVPFTEELIARTRQLAAELRLMGQAQVPPRPLDDSPKCPRCSLVGICLPDETRLLQIEGAEPNELSDGDSLASGTAQEEAATGAATRTPPGTKVRRLFAARDDAQPLYVQEQGAMVGKSGQALTIKKSGKMVAQVRMLDVSQVCLFGNVMISPQALRDLAGAGVPICHFSYGGWFSALTSGLIHKNVELRQAQFAIAADTMRSLEFGRQFVLGKIKNCRTLLRRNLQGDATAVLRDLADLARRAAAACDAGSLLGLEGMAAKAYFAGFARLLKGDQAFEVEGRNRRPPRDPVNALLSFVYALLVKELTIVLHSVGFDPMLGFYHRPRYGRPSLALDLAEPFRPLVGDSVVLTLVNNGEVKPEDFIRRAGGVALTEAGRRAVLAAFERRMDTAVTHPIFGYQASYRRVLEIQARLLARAVLGEIPQYPNFCTR